MAPPGPSARDYQSCVSRGLLLPDQVTATSLGCQNDFAYSPKLKTFADSIKYNVRAAKLNCTLQFQSLSINNKRAAK